MAVTLQQIAEACRVSRGTVDRALHNKEGVRPEVAQRIREVAREMGYIPRHASPLAAAGTVRIGVVLHTGISDFVQQLAKIILAFPAQSLLPIEVILRVMDGTDVHHQLALIDDLVQNEQLDGLILMPLAHTLIRDKINALTDADGLPVVTVNTDMSDSARLAYVGPDNIACGRTAASLMGMATQGKGHILPILGQRSGHFADTQRLSGFLAEMTEYYPSVSVLPPEYCFLDQGLAERITRRVLREVDDLTGIYISSVGRSGVYRVLSDIERNRHVHVVVHDLTEDNLQMVRKGVVDFVIGQDVKTQGSLPLQLLFQFLTKHQAPERKVFLTEIDIRLRTNLL